MIKRELQNKVVLFLSRFPWLLKITTSFYRFFLKKIVENKRNQYFNNRALSVLKDFSECMDKNGHFYTLAFGTLLGAIREKGFIKHDSDIDIYMWAKDYNSSLEKDLKAYGFKLSHGFEVQKGEIGRELTFEKNGVGIDIFFIYPPIFKYPYCCDFLAQQDCQNSEIAMKRYGHVIVRRIEMPFIRERVLVDFESLKLYIPQNADDLLRFRYGSNYMTPNPNWTINSFNDNIIVWEDKFGIMLNR